MKHTFAVALMLVGATISIPAQAESPDRVDPMLDCSTPVLDAETPEKAKLLRIQYGGDALVRELSETYASRLAGLFWDQKEGDHSRLVLRLTGDEPVEDRKLEVCGEPLTIAFVTGQRHTREELQKLHVDDLNWLRDKFHGLQGTYADERSGEIVLEIYQPEAEEIDLEALRRDAETRLDAPLRVEMTTAKVVVGPGLRAPADPAQ